MSLKILFEDNCIIAINKECGIPVIPGRGKDEDVPLVNIVEQHILQKPFVVHRLDKETSGVLLFAKDSTTHRHLNIQFEKKEINKEYLAVVKGVPEKNGTIDAPIYQFGSGRMGIDSRGKSSVTRYTMIEPLKDAAVLKVCPLTGRRHQIRVHHFSIGHPIMGDPLYGHPRPVGGINRLMLHAHKIHFKHPDGSYQTIDAPTDHQWNQIVNDLKQI